MLILSSLILGQSYSTDFFMHNDYESNLDHGIGWISNSSFSQLRLKHLNEKNKPTTSDSSKIEFRLGVISNNKDIGFLSYSVFSFKNLYSFAYNRIVTNPSAFDRFSGKARKVRRFGFNSFETDQSGIGYHKGNFFIEFGRGRQIWGVGNDMQISLSKYSNPYDYGMISFLHNNYRFVYFHGYLENIEGWNRYINGRGIEYNNYNNFLMSLSEIIIYSGNNRPLDFAYLNPILFHFEIEMNERQNNLELSDGSANAVWQFSIDYFSKNKFRISFNFLIDEIVIDKIERDANKDNGLGYSLKISKSVLNKGTKALSFYATSIAIGTHTFRHDVGTNNFVNRGRPLGWQGGSDSKQGSIGFTFKTKSSLIIDGEIIKYTFGRESLINSSYLPYQEFSDYLDTPFPSGLIKTNYITKIRIQYMHTEKSDLSVSLKIGDYSAQNKSKYELNFFFAYYFDSI